MHKHRKILGKRPYRFALGTFILLALISACSTPEVIEVTRIVTETGIVETEPEVVEIEVTRVVTETITETVVIETEAEEEDDVAAEEPAPPSATGSEGDSGPLPPAPDDGPKITSRAGSTPSNDGEAITEIMLETAVPRRSNPIEQTNAPQAILITAANAMDATEWQKWCLLTQSTYKKWCD